MPGAVRSALSEPRPSRSSRRRAGRRLDPHEAAAKAGLRYVHEDDAGIGRVPLEGGRFGYIGPSGRRISNPRVLERIRKLVIPPAYQDVWICADPRGHIQATGRDARGRKQYRYHPLWRTVRDQNKFAHMAAFGRALPAIRAALDEDLARPGLSHDKVLATAVRLLELTLIRVGNDEYARTNQSFGLTTLLNHHVKADGSRLVFEFMGKSGVKHVAGLRDRRLAYIIRRLQDLPGQRLFQYVDQDGQRHNIGSADVNAYIRRRSGADFTAKDFRTWAGTLAAAKALATHPPVESASQIKAATARCVKLAAALLGNTPAVCRSAYIHPSVIDFFATGDLPSSFATAQGELLERAVLRFLAITDGTG